MNSISYGLLIILLFYKVQSYAQEVGKVLIVSSEDALLYIDGEEIRKLKQNKPFETRLEPREYVVQVISQKNFEEKNVTLEVKTGQLKVLKFDFSDNSVNQNSEGYHVAALDFTIPGIVTINGHGNYNPTVFYYAFENGDQILLNAQTKNRKGTNAIKIYAYPDEVLIYQNNSFRDLEDVRIYIEKRSIYRFEFFSNHTFDRKLHFEIARIPESPGSKDFNTSVIDRYRYEAKSLVKKEIYSISSAFNSTFQDSESRVTIPLIFPSNTVKWYYRYSASQNKEDIERLKYSYNLAGELALSMGPKAELVPSGTNGINPVPGSDNCDVFLLDQVNKNLFNNYNPFNYIIEGSRENFSSGIVEVDCCTGEPHFLGIQNPNESEVVHVFIEVVVIVEEAEIRMQEN